MFVAATSVSGQALESAGPKARPRRGDPLDSGVITPPCSVNRAMTILMKILQQNNCMNIKIRQIIGVDLYVEHMKTKQFLLWGVGITHVSPSYGHVYE